MLSNFFVLNSKVMPNPEGNWKEVVQGNLSPAQIVVQPQNPAQKVPDRSAQLSLSLAS